MVFYESPHRLMKTLNDFIHCFGPERPASVSRELTKKFEETIKGSLQSILDHFQEGVIKGEFVIIVKGD